MNYREAVEDVQNRTNDMEDPALEKTEEALEDLGRPDQDCKVILIGGTNGKGSTAEYVSRLLQAQGFRVGKFTSPHLVTLRERINVDGEKISRDEFMDLYSRLKDLDLTFFEFMTVAAYLYFSDQDVDYAVMEVGMGGRLDSTNAGGNGYALITNIGRDHSQYLGETREEIAREKAGIIPENGLYLNSSDMEIIDSIAEERNCREIEKLEMTEVAEEKYRIEDRVFNADLDEGFQLENLENAASMVSAIEGLPEAIEDAIEEASTEGRMERLDDDIILDGAHNPSALRKTISNFEDGFICVFGVMKDKDVDEMLEIIGEKASGIYAVTPETDRAMEPEDIARKAPVDARVFDKPVEALEEARKKDRQVVVTGSLYLIGDLKKQLEQRGKQWRR